MERSEPSAKRTPGTGSRLLLKNWRVRSRLIALIIIPTMVGVVLGAVQLANAVATSSEYGRLTEVALLVQKIDTLVHEVDRERDLTAWYLADGRRQARLKKVRAQQAVVDQAREPVLAAVAALDPSHTARVRAEAEQIRLWLEGLPGLRGRITAGVPSRAALGIYSRLIGVLTTVQSELGSSGKDQRLFGDAIALGALSRAKEEVSRQRGLMTVGLTTLGSYGGGFDYDDFVDFPGSWSRQETETATFLSEARPEDAKFYNETVRGQQVDKADWMRALALAQLRQFKEIQDLDPIRRDDTTIWYTSTSAVADRMRKVEERLVGSVVQQSQALQADAERQATISGAVIIVLLLLVLVITAVVASSLTRPLRRLRAEALEIAGSRLPQTVQRLREGGDAAPVADVVPIGVDSRDEMGEVARAFDEVHREAIRLAGDEARLRSNVNAMFVNLSRRSQTLVERQLSLIEGLEQGEEDETRLGNLFKLDHLATRMRRNSENLLVLAGQETVRKWSEPVPLVDVCRASLSEVEGYERVDVRVEPGTAVIGQAVNDVVHLVAELVENAVSFSPRETKVVITSNRVDGGGVMLSVSDAGIGMTAEEASEANWRLSNPPVVDVSVSRRMGLFVVGRLALRHHIKVQLRGQDNGGLVAMVMLPEGLLSTPGAPRIPGLPAESADAGMFAGPAQSSSFGGGFAAASPGLEAPARGMRAPVFGADDPGVPVGPGPVNRGPFERGPFERSPLPTRDPFERPPAAAPGSPFANTPPAGRAAADQGPFGQDAVNVNDLFDRYFDPNPPIDTPWPADVPAPGSDVAESASWSPDPADGDTASWPAFGSGPAGPASGPRPMAGAGPVTGGAAGPMSGPVGPVTGGGAPTASFGAVTDDHTGPLPVVHSSPLDGGEEFLPIFAAVESDWFRRSDIPQTPAGPGTGPAAEPAAPQPLEPRAEEVVVPEPAEGGGWSSPADAGWHAAKAASDPSLGGITSSGLPKRVPKANLVPGSADPGPSVFSPQPSLSPDRVRSRLSSFQQGVRKGRAVARGEQNDDFAANWNADRNKEDS
ncbi:hypothetical protein Sme01_40330 [Sphaerisporangium melleum]|uniref:histidine kinase n=1 Tax=Sphaerisporangium melleum TaxID=321316 RepID=A0A917RRP8_9ACTN|nr:nitrate- and nitrite sensing domain-containing protein [Sphaerisporangium melleum]GGL21272.1 hypothetical protein GCM10007964_74020 [Sphaerisporangium melleum]GII71557.1 hypothetical protein Sme01_40330 [Sphaerisporangium melleum]